MFKEICVVFISRACCIIGCLLNKPKFWIVNFCEYLLFQVPFVKVKKNEALNPTGS